MRFSTPAPPSSWQIVLGAFVRDDADSLPVPRLVRDLQGRLGCDVFGAQKELRSLHESGRIRLLPAEPEAVAEGDRALCPQGALGALLAVAEIVPGQLADLVNPTAAPAPALAVAS